MLVGEVGISRKEFLYDLKLWEVRSIIKGYRCRSHAIWESARLNAFFSMSAMADLRKSGIHRDTDLIKFPWEKKIEPGDQPTMEQVEEMRRLIREENERLAKKGAAS